MAAPRRFDEPPARGLESVERSRGGAIIYRVVFGDWRQRRPLEHVSFDDIEPRAAPRGDAWGWIWAVAGHAALIALGFVALAPDPPRDTVPEQGMTVELISEPDTAAGERTERPLAAGEQASASDSQGRGPGAAILATPRAVPAQAAATGEAVVPDPPAPSFAAGPAAPERRDVPAVSGTVASGAGSVSPDEAKWEGAIVARIEKRKRFPKAAMASGIEDRIMLRLFIDREGRLIRAEIARSKGHAALNAEVIELARRASPYPRPPASVLGEEISVVVPVEFLLKQER